LGHGVIHSDIPFWERGRSKMKDIIPGQTISLERIMEKFDSGRMSVVYNDEDTSLILYF